MESKSATRSYKGGDTSKYLDKYWFLPARLERICFKQTHLDPVNGSAEKKKFLGCLGGN
jgi:hypothetical protein